MSTGRDFVDRALSLPKRFGALRVVIALLALGAAVMVFRVGNLGAKTVWQGRSQAAQAQASAAR